MPIYLYEPTLWTENEPVKECCFFEKIQSFKEEPLIHCPTCGHEIHRAVTSFSISTKDNPQSGEDDFYKTFNKKKDSPASKAAQLAMRHICSSGCQH